MSFLEDLRGSKCHRYKKKKFFLSSKYQTNVKGEGDRDFSGGGGVAISPIFHILCTLLLVFNALRLIIMISACFIIILSYISIKIKCGLMRVLLDFLEEGAMLQYFIVLHFQNLKAGTLLQ